MGENALMLWNIDAFFSPTMSAPWPPIEWPKTDMRLKSNRFASCLSSCMSSLVTYEYMRYCFHFSCVAST